MMPEECYLPTAHQIRTQSKKNSQGRDSEDITFDKQLDER